MDSLLDEAGDPEPGPEVRYERREAISLAFVTALQLLPPRQRVVLTLRDVLGFLAAEAAKIITLTGDKMSAITRFDNSVITRFGLPRTLPNGSPD